MPRAIELFHDKFLQLKFVFYFCIVLASKRIFWFLESCDKVFRYQFTVSKFLKFRHFWKRVKSWKLPQKIHSVNLTPLLLFFNQGPRKRQLTISNLNLSLSFFANEVSIIKLKIESLKFLFESWTPITHGNIPVREFIILLGVNLYLYFRRKNIAF